MKKMIFFLLVFSNSLHAQMEHNFCDYIETEKKDFESMEKHWILYNQTNVSLRVQSEENYYEIPVVFKIISNSINDTLISDKQVYECLEFLNQVFSNRPTKCNNIASNYYEIPENGIRFKLAHKNENGNMEKGIIRKYYDSILYPIMPVYSGFNNNNFSNLAAKVGDWFDYYFEETFDKDSFLTVYLISNYTSSISGSWNGSYIKIKGSNNFPRYPYFCSYSSHVLIHEIGHSLGLKHTFSNFGLDGGCVCNETNSLTQGDLIDDTPPDPTPANNTNCTSDITYNCINQLPALTNNLMDYVSPPTRFTPHQIERMIFTLENERVYDYNLCDNPAIAYLIVADTLINGDENILSLQYENNSIGENALNIVWKVFDSLHNQVATFNGLEINYIPNTFGKHLLSVAITSIENPQNNCSQILYKDLYILNPPKLTSSNVIFQNMCNGNNYVRKMEITNIGNISQIQFKLVDTNNFYIINLSNTSCCVLQKQNNISQSLATVIVYYFNGYFVDSFKTSFFVIKNLNFLNYTSTAATYNLSSSLYNCDASLNISIQGGKPPYSFQWQTPTQCNNSNIFTGAYLNNIAFGWYAVRVRDQCNKIIDNWYWVSNVKRGRGRYDFVENKMAYHFYPNPTFDLLFIDFFDELNTDKLKCSIFDLSGKLESEFNVEAKNNLTIDFSQKAKGMYRLIIQNDNDIIFNESLTKQ